MWIEQDAWHVLRVWNLAHLSRLAIDPACSCCKRTAWSSKCNLCPLQGPTDLRQQPILIPISKIWAGRVVTNILWLHLALLMLSGSSTPLLLLLLLLMLVQTTVLLGKTRVLTVGLQRREQAERLGCRGLGACLAHEACSSLQAKCSLMPPGTAAAVHQPLVGLGMELANAALHVLSDLHQVLQKHHEMLMYGQSTSKASVKVLQNLRSIMRLCDPSKLVAKGALYRCLLSFKWRQSEG